MVAVVRERKATHRGKCEYRASMTRFNLVLQNLFRLRCKRLLSAFVILNLVSIIITIIIFFFGSTLRTEMQLNGPTSPYLYVRVVNNRLNASQKSRNLISLSEYMAELCMVCIAFSNILSLLLLTSFTHMAIS